MPVPLDAIDHALLEQLQADAKASLAELGAHVGLSAPSVMERIRKLEASGVITGYHAALDARRLGLDITAFIGVSINYPKDIERFLEELGGRPQVLECHHVTGGHTLLLKVKTRNTASLESLLSAVREVEGVTRTETMVVLSTKSESARVSLADLSPTVEAPARRRRGKRAV